MSPETLLRQFGVLADAPNGVQKLRELILQLAVRGKLVPQDPSDEPASVLLERIAAEKQRLFEEGRIGKPKSLPPVSDDEVPFEVPEGWEWVRFGRVHDFTNGFAFQSQDYRSQGVGIVRISDLVNGRVEATNVKRVPARLLEALDSKLQVRRGDLLIGMSGSIGKVAFCASDEVLLLNQRVGRIAPILVDKFFVYFFLRTVEQRYLDISFGSAIKNLSTGQIRATAFPLPPLPEQQRIVAKVDELMALCDELEARQQRRAEARARLNRSALHHLTAASDDAELAAHWQRLREHFHLLYDTPEMVAELRQAVLQLAVRGRVVPFDPDAVARPLGSILAEASMNGIATKPHDEPVGTPILRISAGTSRRDALIDETDHKYLDLDAETVEKFRLFPGDLLACRFNGNLHYVGRLSLYTGYMETTHVYPDKLIRFRVDREQADPAYVRYAFNAPDTRQEIESFCATTAGNIGISAGRLKTITFPLPPLPEQQRIVEKVDELMALCDRLEARLSRAREKSAHLAASVVHHLTAA